MIEAKQTIEACPKCKSAEHVRQKLVLLDQGYPEYADYKWRTPYSCCPSAMDVRPEYVADSPSGQFVTALYCEHCGIGFIPEYMAKPEKLLPIYKPVPGGFRRVYADDSLGPLLEQMPDVSELKNAELEPWPTPDRSGIGPYKAIVWVGDKPGVRAEVLASSFDEAESKIREQYGEEAEVKLWTDEHNESPR